jgi:predicted nuclease with TOPRIM domain
LKIAELPPSKIYILQGERLRENVPDLPESIQWIDWKDKKLYSQQQLIEKNLQRFLSKLESKKIINQTQLDMLQAISNILATTEQLFQKLPDILNFYKVYEEFFSFLKLFSERTELVQELKWAQYFEKKSKTSVGLKRLEKLNDEISLLEKKKQTIEPQYFFLKEQHDQYKNSITSLNIRAKEINKSIIIKTRKINKLKRQIDAEKPKSELYTEKITEIISTVDSSELKNDENYNRISKKLQNVNQKISQFTQEILKITEGSSQLKAELKDLKKKIKQLKENYTQTGSKFSDIETTYFELLKQLENKEKEKADLIHYQSMENTSQNMGEPPANIRFSSIIKEDLSANSTKLSKYLPNPDTSGQRYIDHFFESWSLPKSFLKASNLSIQSVTEENLQYFQKILKTIESEMRSLLKPLALRISFQKLPLITQDHQTIPKLGIQFEILKNKKKILLEKLSPEERLYVMFTFNYSINKICGITSHLFRDRDYKIKRTKKLFEQLIRLIKKGILSKNPEHTIFLLLSKPLLENTTQKEMVITTIPKN